MKAKKKIFIFLIIFFLISTFYPYDPKKEFNFTFKFFDLKTITIKSKNKTFDNIVISKLKNFYGENILFIRKDSIIQALDEIQFIENINIMKKLPNELIISLDEIVPIATYEKNSDKFLISSSNKSIEIINYEKYSYLPEVYQMQSVEEFIDFYNILEKTRFPTDLIKNYTFFKIGRWDLVLTDDTVIKLPSSKIIQALEKLNLVLKTEYLGKVKLIDLRIENQIITQ